MTGNILAAQDTSFPVMQKKLKQYTDIVMSDPAVKSMVGDTGGGSENTGGMDIELKPLNERKVTVGSSDRAPPAQARSGSRGHVISTGESRHHGRRTDQ